MPDFPGDAQVVSASATDLAACGSDDAVAGGRQDDATWCQLPLPPVDQVASRVSQLLHIQPTGNEGSLLESAVGASASSGLAWVAPNLDMLVLHVKADDLGRHAGTGACLPPIHPGAVLCLQKFGCQSVCCLAAAYLLTGSEDTACGFSGWVCFSKDEDQVQDSSHTQGHKQTSLQILCAIL